MSKSIQLINNNNEKIFPNPHFPVGSIYLSVLNTNPKVWFGGKWELIAKGRTLVGVDTDDVDFNEAKKIGGEKKHKLTKEELPPIDINTSFATPSTSGGYGNGLQYGDSSGNSQNILVKNVNAGNKEHNNLQPYFTCFIWCRIA